MVSHLPLPGIHPFLLLAQYPFCARASRLTLESPVMPTSMCRNLLLLQDNESSCCKQGQHRVQVVGGIEGDGDNRGDGDEDGESCQP